MLDFICMGSAELFGTGRERKIQKENYKVHLHNVKYDEWSIWYQQWSTMMNIHVPWKPEMSPCVLKERNNGNIKSKMLHMMSMYNYV